MKLNWKILGGGGVQYINLSMRGVWIFPGTAHCVFQCVYFKQKNIILLKYKEAWGGGGGGVGDSHG